MVLCHKSCNKRRACRLTPLHRFELIHAVSDSEVWLDRRKRLFVGALVSEVLKAILRVEAVDLTEGIALGIVPEENIDAVRKGNNRTHAGLPFETGSVYASLLGTDAGKEGQKVASFLQFNEEVTRRVGLLTSCSSPQGGTSALTERTPNRSARRCISQPCQRPPVRASQIMSSMVMTVSRSPSSRRSSGDVQVCPCAGDLR